MNTINQLSILAVCYVFLFLLFLLVWKKKSENLASPNVQNGNWTWFHIRHAVGIIIMVFIPMLLLPVVNYGLLEIPGSINQLQVITLLVTGLLLLILSAKASDSIETKKIAGGSQSTFNAVVHILLRNSFLVAYEWFFRGLILFSCVSLFGIFPAVLINLFLYASIHLINGKKEFLGSIPFGIILCGFTLWWHSVWPAILLHLLLSASYESVILHQFFCKPSKINL